VSEMRFLDSSRKRSLAEVLEIAPGFDRGTAVRLASMAGQRLEVVLRLLGSRGRAGVMSLLDEPVSGPMLDYNPRTGPLPDGLVRGEVFTHDAVVMTPKLARVLLGNYTDRARPANLQRVDGYVAAIEAAQDDPEFGGFRDVIAVSKSGKTVGGQHLLRAIVEWGSPVLVDVVHNVSSRAWRHGVES